MSTLAGLKGVLERPLVHRVLTFVGAGLALALITGPDGSQAKPWSGIHNSLLTGRVVRFVLLPALLAVLVDVARSDRASVARSGVASARVAVGGVWSHQRVRQGLYVAFAVAILVIPHHLSNFWLTVTVDQIGIYVLLAMGLNVVVGFAGLLDLGFIAFYAIGAYTTAYFTGKLHDANFHKLLPPIVLNPFFIFPIAIFVAMLAGLLLGAPTLRLRGDYLAIVTLGFGEIVRITAVNTDKVGGPNGVFGLPHFSVNLWFVHYNWGLSQIPYYYLLVVVVGLVWFLLHRLDDSRIGRALTAIREDEVAAEASGVPTLKFKLMAFAIGASTSGFAGVIYASKVGSFTPDNFVLIQSLLVLVMVIFGGMGSIPGVMLGAFVLGWLPNYLRDSHFGLPAIKPTDRFIYFGLLLIVMMIFRPQGLLPSKRRAREIALEENPDLALEGSFGDSPSGVNGDSPHGGTLANGGRE